MSRKKHHSSRPEYHFTPPQNWMNDPNACIYYSNQYHLFYQHNPFKNRWGSIHWGHASSPDLITWTHLPIALHPSTKLKEHHCFSGSLVMDHTTPTILYTSIRNLIQIITGGEMWIARATEGMKKWEKDPQNPVMTSALHPDLKIRHWRDPFVWQENDTWYAVLGGQLRHPRRGAAFLYQSSDLIHWTFLHVLHEGKPKRDRAWECPNFFSMGLKHILIVSPFNSVRYYIGEYKDHVFQVEKEGLLDQGRHFYATQLVQDNLQDHEILGWIKGVGDKSWNGSLSIPRILSLNPEGQLIQDPHPHFQRLRINPQQFDGVHLTKTESKLEITIPDNGTCLEIECEFTLVPTTSVNFSRIKQSFRRSVRFLNLNKKKNTFQFGNETITTLSLENDSHRLHIFIDHQIGECFYQNTSCITARIQKSPARYSRLLIRLKKGEITFQSLRIYQLQIPIEKQSP